MVWEHVRACVPQGLSQDQPAVPGGDLLKISKAIFKGRCSWRFVLPALCFRAAFRSSQEASVFLPGVWHKQLDKPQELRRVFFSLEAAFGSSPERRRARWLPPIKVTALSTAPPAMIATLAVLYINSGVFWEDFFILQVLLKSDGCSHHSVELNVVHHIAAGVSSEVFFNCFFFFATEPMPAARPVSVVVSRTALTSLLLDIVYI